MSISKVVSAEDAVSVIRSNDNVASSGYGGHGVAEEVLIALEDRFLETGAPRDLTLIWAGGQGDLADRGLNHFGHEGLLRRTIGGHYGLVPRIAELAVDEKIEAYNLPEGILVIYIGISLAVRRGSCRQSASERSLIPVWRGGRSTRVPKTIS